MLPRDIRQGPKEALNQRLDSIGWGLFLLIIGILWLIPDQRVPEGAWLIVAGIIMLGVNGVRYLNDIKMRGSTIFLGVLAVVFGMAAFAGIDLPFFPVMLMLVGADLILRPWLAPLLEQKET